MVDFICQNVDTLFRGFCKLKAYLVRRKEYYISVILPLGTFVALRGLPIYYVGGHLPRNGVHHQQNVDVH